AGRPPPPKKKKGHPPRLPRLRRWLGCLRAARRLVLPLKPLDAASRVDQFLLPGKERVTGGADFHTDIALVRGARLERVATGASDVDLVISGVNTDLHGQSFREYSVYQTDNPPWAGKTHGGGSLRSKPEA